MLSVSGVTSMSKTSFGLWMLFSINCHLLCAMKDHTYADLRHRVHSTPSVDAGRKV